MFKYKIFSRENTIVDLRRRYEERNCQHFERMGVERGQDEGKWRRIGESTSRERKEKIKDEERKRSVAGNSELHARELSDHKFECIMQRQSSPPLWVHFAEVDGGGDKVRRGTLSSNESWRPDLVPLRSWDTVMPLRILLTVQFNPWYGPVTVYFLRPPPSPFLPASRLVFPREITGPDLSNLLPATTNNFLSFFFFSPIGAASKLQTCLSSIRCLHNFITFPNFFFFRIIKCIFFWKEKEKMLMEIRVAWLRKENGNLERKERKVETERELIREMVINNFSNRDVESETDK